jgi:hypothetical protein
MRLPRVEDQSPTAKLASAEPRAWMIALAVFLAALIPMLADIGLFVLNRSALAANIPENSLGQLGYNLLTSLLSFLDFFFPLIAGYGVALLWPKYHWYWYAVFGLLISGLQISLAISGYHLLRTAGPDYDWDWTWSYITEAFGLLPFLLFISGGLIGDLLKMRAFDPQLWMSGVPQRLANAISRITGIANKELLVTYVRYILASSPAVIAVLGVLIRTLDAVLSPT